VEQLKYLETALTNQNSFNEEFNIRLKSENACCYYYYSVQNLLSFGLLAKNIKILENCNFARFV